MASTPPRPSNGLRQRGMDLPRSTRYHLFKASSVTKCEEESDRSIKKLPPPPQSPPPLIATRRMCQTCRGGTSECTHARVPFKIHNQAVDNYGFPAGDGLFLPIKRTCTCVCVWLCFMYVFFCCCFFLSAVAFFNFFLSPSDVLEL